MVSSFEALGVDIHTFSIVSRYQVDLTRRLPTDSLVGRFPRLLQRPMREVGQCMQTGVWMSSGIFENARGIAMQNIGNEVNERCKELRFGGVAYFFGLCAFRATMHCFANA